MINIYCIYVCVYTPHVATVKYVAMYVTGKTEYQDLNKLLIPTYQVQFIIKLGEGMVYYCTYIAGYIIGFLMLCTLTSIPHLSYCNSYLPV